MIINNDAYNHIIVFDKNNDGKKVWITLKSFYIGEDLYQRLQDEAFMILSDTSYQGESTRFNFKSYVNRLQKADKLLQETSYSHPLGMDEPTEIQHLKTSIRLEVGLEHAL